MSEDVIGCRMSLDIRPVDTAVKSEEQIMQRLSFAFNFHSDVTTESEEDVITQIKQQLQRWDQARLHACVIVDGLEELL